MGGDVDLKAAVQAARSGNVERAREMLAALVCHNPNNFYAWLWLSELAATLEEQLAALKHAQELCPPNSEGERDLQPYFNQLRSAVPLPAPGSAAAARPATPTVEKRAPMDPFFQAERMWLAGKREEAIRMLVAMVEQQPQEERAWLLLSEMQPDPQEKFRLLEKVLAINPANSAAAHRLETLRPIQEDPFKRGQYMEEAGDYDQAIRLYQLIIAHSTSPTERLEASRRIANIQLRQESDQAQAVHPTLNLARVTVGPVLLFFMMVFIQSGLSLVNTPILAVPGIISVLVGSFLVSATTMRPLHPRWIALFGAPGAGSEPQIRQRLRLAGWLCMLAPFSIFLIEASFRLGALRASMIEGLP